MLVIAFTAEALAKTEMIFYQGIDGENRSCAFSYSTLTKKGRLDLEGFNFRPLPMTFSADIGDYQNVFWAKDPVSELTVIAESFTGAKDESEVMQNLDLITVVEEHGDHNHVWFCYNLSKPFYSLRNSASYTAEPILSPSIRPWVLSVRK